MFTVVIVPCGKSKVWDRQPRRGTTPASSVYTGALHKVAQRYARRHADKWYILSAKYGIIRPDFLIPETYDVTFNTGDGVSVATLRRQVRAERIHRASKVIVVGGTVYCSVVEQALSKWRVIPECPFRGLPIGKMLQAINQVLNQREGFGL